MLDLSGFLYSGNILRRSCHFSLFGVAAEHFTDPHSTRSPFDAKPISHSSFSYGACEVREKSHEYGTKTRGPRRTGPDCLGQAHGMTLWTISLIRVYDAHSGCFTTDADHRAG